MDINFTSSPHGLNENLWWDVEFLVQITDHIQRQRSLALHDFINSRSLTDEPDHCARVFPFLFQPEFDRFDRIGEFNRIVFLLVRLDQRGKYVQFVAFRRTFGGISQLLQPALCPLVICFASNGFDVHISPFSHQSCRNPCAFRSI